MKYIIVDTGFQERAYLFSGGLNHSDVAARLNVRDQIVSAGHVRISCDGAFCYGESITLKVRSRDQDTAILNKELEFEE